MKRSYRKNKGALRDRANLAQWGRSGKIKFFKYVQIWQGGEPELAICVERPVLPPAHLCFRENGEETTAFFDMIRRSFFYTPVDEQYFIFRPKSPSKLPRVAGYSDFAQIHQISTSAAVVLAADYERIAVLNGEVPPTIELHTWTDAVFSRLFQLGFFEAVGHVAERDELLKETENSLTMQVISSRNADDLREASRALEDLGRFLDPEHSIPEAVLIPFITGLSEAMTNVTQHAYPDNHEFEFEQIGKFWIAATANRVNQTLTVVFYDQGVSIPVTYPKLATVGWVIKYLRRALRQDQDKEFDYQNDGTYIRAALKYGSSQTKEPHRGKGLPQMRELIRTLGKGSLHIRSRGGWCNCDAKGRIKSGSSVNSIGGTLIEWRVEL